MTFKQLENYISIRNEIEFMYNGKNILSHIGIQMKMKIKHLFLFVSFIKQQQKSKRLRSFGTMFPEKGLQ